ncbi:MAG: nucleotidyltransferase domain-containing protein [Synechococcaceae bacterium WB8_1B_136]|nr:nucleotidyltransferase domain-containing protein [Synechococcaceae bacterium WB8_1B_136]
MAPPWRLVLTPPTPWPAARPQEADMAATAECTGRRASWPVLGGFAMMKSMTTTPSPLVTREALQAFTQRLVERYAPEKVILFGSLARGEGRWDSDADILVVMPFEGRHLAKIREMRRLCPVRFPLDLLVRRPEEMDVRYRGGDPVVREALDHGEVLHG